MENIIHHGRSGIEFERHDDDGTGDVTIRLEGMGVRIPSNEWVSVVAAMTCHGEQANHADFKIMHTGVGTQV